MPVSNYIRWALSSTSALLDLRLRSMLPSPLLVRFLLSATCAADDEPVVSYVRKLKKPSGCFPAEKVALGAVTMVW
jgi:hypothetical protein